LNAFWIVFCLRKKEMMKKKGKRRKVHNMLCGNEKLGVVLLVVTLFALFSFVFVLADPVGPDDLVFNFNKTKNVTSAQMYNISGGYIGSFNLSATVQNPRWKAFIGHVAGSFTLADASGNEIYDWSLASVSGRVYATRAQTNPDWGNINCSNTTDMENENSLLSHSGSADNLTVTFGQGSTHDAFQVGAKVMQNCPYNLHTYRDGNKTQTSADPFDEVVLEDNNGTLVYATIIENNVVGFDNEVYDFQMIVPENGSASWSSATPYYLYVEIVS
jgi:hypothetical protein